MKYVIDKNDTWTKEKMEENYKTSKKILLMSLLFIIMITLISFGIIELIALIQPSVDKINLVTLFCGVPLMMSLLSLGVIFHEEHAEYKSDHLLNNQHFLNTKLVNQNDKHEVKLLHELIENNDCKILDDELHINIYVDDYKELNRNDYLQFEWNLLNEYADARKIESKDIASQFIEKRILSSAQQNQLSAEQKSQLYKEIKSKNEMN